MAPRRPLPLVVAREGVTMQFIYEPEFWVAVSFFIFIGVLVYFGVHMKVAARSMRARF